MNLATLNSLKQVKEVVEYGITVRDKYAIGKSGPGGSRGHLLFVQEVVSLGSVTNGVPASCVVACDQSDGTVVIGWDLKDLTCAKCEKILDRIKANLRKPKGAKP